MEQLDQQPAPDASPMAQTPPAPQPPRTPDAVLDEQLRQCRSAVSGCFEFCSHADVSVPQQLEVLTVASRLMRVSVALADALDKTPREFTHHVIVEHRASIAGAALESMGDPPPLIEKSKTIHSGREPRAYNIE